MKRAVGRRPGSFSLQAFPCPFQMVHSQEELVLPHGRVHGPRSCRRSPGDQSGKSGGLDGANPDDCRGAHHSENARIRPRLARRVRPSQPRPAPGTGAGSLGSRRGEPERTRTTAGQSRWVRARAPWRSLSRFGFCPPLLARLCLRARLHLLFCLHPLTLRRDPGLAHRTLLVTRSC